jgi:tetratricopeptide (TPR) repeat protein
MSLRKASWFGYLVALALKDSFKSECGTIEMTAFRRASCQIAIGLLVAATLASCSLEARKARYLEHGEKYFKAGEYDNAKIEYMKLLFADPQNALPFQRLGFIWLEEGAPLRAISFLSKARDLAPNDLSNRLNLARTFMSLARVADARKEVMAVLEQSPAHDDALVLLADTDQTKEDREYTRQYLDKLPEHNGLAFQLTSANLAVQSGDFASAVVLLERAVTLDPKSPLPHLAMATLATYRNKLTDAEREFKTAAELSPIRSSTRLRYADFKIQHGGGNDVKEFLKEITRQAPDSLPAWCFLSQIALANGKHNEALSLLENVFSRDSQNPEARLLEAQVWLAKGETQKAVERFEDLEKTYTNVPLINYHLALAYLQNKNPGQATIALGHAIAAKPDYLEAILLRAELDLESGNASLVVPSMVNLLTQRPHLLAAELILTEAYLSLGRLDEAAAVIREQTRMSPAEPDPYYRLGLVLREDGKGDEAQTAFEKVLELEPGNLMAVNQLVDLDIAKRDFNSAMSRVETLLKKSPVPAVAYFMEGKTYAAQGKFAEAEASLLKAIELDSNSLGNYQLLVSVYLSANKPDQAIRQLEILLSKDPEITWALVTLASTYVKVGDFAKARDSYERLLSTNPNSAEALNALAALYNDRFNQPDKAYNLAAKARALAPVDPRIAATLGWILYKQGDYQQALGLLQEAVIKLPDDPDIQFRFGMASYMMDQSDIARAAFKKAAQVSADSSMQEEARRWLAFLEDDVGAPKQLSKAELESLVRQRPNDLVARTHLAALYEQEGAAAAAAAQYEAALNINPKLLDATLKLAQLYAGPLHDFSKALELAKSARDLDKGNPPTEHILGKIAYLTGNFSWAHDLLLASAHGQKEDPITAYDLAWAAYSLGKVAEAQQSMRSALKLGLNSENSVEAKRFLALTTPQESADMSETSVEKLLKDDPTYVPALMIQASIDTRRGDSKKAIDTYSKVLQRFPDFAPAQKFLAGLYLEDPSALDRAYELAVKARSTLENDPDLARMLGEMSYRRGEFDYALQLLQESTKTKPLDAKGLYYLGMSQFQMQQEAQSQGVLERSLASGLPEPFAADARRILAGMQKRN